MTSVFISNLKNPFVNLSIEHYLFKHTAVNQWPLLFLYVNDPCVVVGRNQNPWKEVNIPLVNAMGVPVVRRRSGGGTVVHDHGNVNFCVMTSREDFTRDRYARLVVDSLNSKRKEGIENTASELMVNDRYDIVTKSSNEKVSGSAYKIERDRAYHHGTMLLNSKLDILRALLHRDVSRLGTIEGRGVGSVKSPVANVQCSKNVFISTVAQAFLASKNQDEFEGSEDGVKFIDSLEDLAPPEAATKINEYTKEISSWGWIYGQTPLFTHKLTDPAEYPGSFASEYSFTVDKGVIISSPGTGLRYRGDELAAKGDNIPGWVSTAIDGWEPNGGPIKLDKN